LGDQELQNVVGVESASTDDRHDMLGSDIEVSFDGLELPHEQKQVVLGAEVEQAVVRVVDLRREPNVVHLVQDLDCIHHRPFLRKTE